MDQDSKMELRYYCRFDEKDGCYYVRLGLYQEGGRREGDSWHKDVYATIFSGNFKVNPLRLGFVPDEEGYKTEKEFRLVPVGKENKLNVSLLIKNQAIHTDRFDDISKLL